MLRNGSFLKPAGFDQGDDIIYVVALLLTSFGLVMVYSASYFIADSRLFLKQLVIAWFGLAAMFAGMRVNPLFWRRWVKIALLVILVAMILQLITPLGKPVKGARRWIDLGFFSFQTSELARCLLVIWIARCFAESPNIGRSLNKKLGLILSVPIMFFILTCMQPDLSSMAMMLLTVSLVLFAGGVRKRYFALAAAVGCPVIYLVLRDYQRERLFSFLIPGNGTEDWPYQQLQALIGLVRGGFEGGGLAHGYQRMLYLPEAHNDFIFAIIGEEWGWLGTTAVLVAFVIIFIRGLKVCLNQSDRFRFLMGVGLLSSMVFYAFVNMGVNIGVLPITGLPLPFISSGGTSLVVSLWSIGILYRLSLKETESE